MFNSSDQNWHPADVMAALRKHKKRWTLRGLSLARGYSAGAVGFALRHPWPAVEEIIAAELGVEPKTIWPSRYNNDGSPKRQTAHPLRNRQRRNYSNRSVA